MPEETAPEAHTQGTHELAETWKGRIRERDQKHINTATASIPLSSPSCCWFSSPTGPDQTYIAAARAKKHQPRQVPRVPTRPRERERERREARVPSSQVTLNREASGGANCGDGENITSPLYNGCVSILASVWVALIAEMYFRIFLIYKVFF